MTNTLRIRRLERLETRPNAGLLHDLAAQLGISEAELLQDARNIADMEQAIGRTAAIERLAAECGVTPVILIADVADLEAQYQGRINS
jgi:uncharacterized protein YidB (DUF937 family)